MEDKDYAREWYEYGIKQKDDRISKFIFLWIAFNWLYSGCQQGTEERNIRRFCELNWKTLAQYDAFSESAFRVFEDGPVTSPMRGRTSVRNLHEDLFCDDEQIRITSLILTIYHVRCNLFHGMKSVNNERDVELVQSSGTILDGYLKAIMGSGFFLK